jgi:hypothetical protein
MEARLLPGRIHRESEFVGRLHGACGPNAASMAERWADQSGLSTLDVFHRMHAAGRCDANGVTTMSQLVADARSAGYRVDALPYREPMPEADWRGFFESHVGRQAIVFETANGQALHDTLSGKGENARNLHYHFVMVAGWHPGGPTSVAQAKGRVLSPGWWCCDGDNFAGGDVMQFYADSVLAAARPCAAMAVYARVGNGSGGGTTMAVPTDWKDDGTTLTAPNGVLVTLGFRGYVLGHDWDANDWPLAAERHTDSIEPGDPSAGAGQRQDFRMTSLGWNSAHGVYRVWVGRDLAALETQLADRDKRIADLEAKLAGGSSGSSGSPASDAATKALDAIHALAAALAKVG